MIKNELLLNLLKENQINIKNFNVEEIEIKDILLKKKRITQKVISEIKQLRLENEEDFFSKKKEINKNTFFKPEEFEAGEHIVWGIEPGSIITDNCLTCDGHGEITCPSCVGTGEEKCYKCNGKTYISKEIIKKETRKVTCSLCGGATTISKNCSVCKGKGNLVFFEACPTCKGMGKLKTGINPKTKMPIFEMCPACNGQKKIRKEKICPSCQGAGLTKITCTKCHGKGEVIETLDRKETQNTPCSFCNQTGRITCRKCRGQQMLICPTCKGDRKTIQYELNKFELKVENDFQLLNNRKISNEAVKIISLDSGKEMDYLYPGEKEKLKSKALELNIKINKNSVRRIEGNLFIFKDKKNKEEMDYYIFTNSRKVFYDLLPPKTSFEANINKYYKKGLFLFNKIKRKYTEIIDKLSNKKTY